MQRYTQSHSAFQLTNIGYIYWTPRCIKSLDYVSNLTILPIQS